MSKWGSKCRKPERLITIFILIQYVITKTRFYRLPRQNCRTTAGGGDLCYLTYKYQLVVMEAGGNMDLALFHRCWYILRSLFPDSDCAAIISKRRLRDDVMSVDPKGRLPSGTLPLESGDRTVQALVYPVKRARFPGRLEG
jgi:hypothetical protein